MVRIVDGIGTSHVPTIGMAYDKGKRNEPAWAALFQGHEPVAQWLAVRKPDAHHDLVPVNLTCMPSLEAKLNSLPGERADQTAQTRDVARERPSKRSTGASSARIARASVCAS